MSVAGVNGPAQSNKLVGQMKQDSYEKNIQKQIEKLQERMKNISNDKEKPFEQKVNEKKEIQEQIQSLNSELRQYQIQKRQRETAQRQEAANESTGNKIHTKQEEKSKTGISEAVNGVLITLSSAKEQISGMTKVRTDLQGKLRTAQTAEEKETLQNKIDKLNEDIGKKIRENQETIEEYQEPEKEQAYNSRSDEDESTREKGHERQENESRSQENSDFVTGGE